MVIRKLVGLSTLALVLLAFSGTSAFASKIVEFHIKKGTGKGAWNTRTEPVKVKVGDTLRLVNDDVIDHYLHTFGKPCDHGAKSFGPGKAYDCQIETTADPDKDICYDHQFGERSRFYIEATE